jgi:hypothetical protein
VIMEDRTLLNSSRTFRDNVTAMLGPA